MDINGKIQFMKEVLVKGENIPYVFRKYSLRRKLQAPPFFDLRNFNVCDIEGVIDFD